MGSLIRALRPLLLLFVFVTALVLVFSARLNEYHIDEQLLLSANVFFLLLSIISFNIQLRGMRNKNPHVFVRSVTGGMLIKMLLCIIAVIIYVFASGDNFNKRGVFLSLLLYLLYLAVEVVLVMKMNKQQHA